MPGTFRLFFCLLLSSFLLAGFSSGQGLKINHLTGTFYVFTTWKDLGGKVFPANGLYAVSNAGVVMIDMPWDTTQTLPLLDSIERKHHQKVVMSISTHFHDDRTGAMDILKRQGIKTWASRQTANLCLEKNEKVPAHTFSKDTTFSIGNLKLRTFYPGEGHTKDNILVWFEKEKVLYGGCFVKSMDNDNIGFIGDADLPEWEKSTQRTIKEFPDPAFVIPGHFGWSNANALNHTLKLVRKTIGGD